MAIGTLSDDALLEIFSIYVGETEWEEAWIALAHVCQRWRHIVFTSPRRLNLRLICTRYRHVMEMLDALPALRISIRDNPETSQVEGVDNILDALERNDRIYQIEFQEIPSSLLELYVEMMQVSFPALTSLELWSEDIPVSVIPDLFMGGSAPRLRSFDLNGVPFPALPKLLVASIDLVNLSVWRTPHSGYIIPEAMVTCLSSLIRLESFTLGFLSSQSYPASNRGTRRPLPLTRVVLPALTFFEFRGVSEYLEDLVARVDAPRLTEVMIVFFNQLLFNTPQFGQFLSRSEKFQRLNRADIIFKSWGVVVSLPMSTSAVNEDPGLQLGIFCKEVDWQLSSIVQVCASSSPALSTLEHLSIQQYIWTYEQPQLQINIEDSTQWLELFQPFSVVKNLYLSKEVMLSVMHPLKGLSGERVTEVLPALQNIFLEAFKPVEPIQEAIKPFIAARQLFGHPVAIHDWQRE